jgi:hypothetical protein
MRGYKHFNFPAFDEAAACLRSHGWTVVSPAEHDRADGFDETKESLEGFDMRGALAWDLDQVVHADAVVLLPGWEDSVGVRAEKAAAEAAKVPLMVFYPGGEDVWRVVPLEAVENAAKVGGEVRVTNATTGGAKGKKPAQLGAVDPHSLLEVAAVAGFGGDKYERYNFTKGFEWSLSFDAFLRHSLAFWGGQDNDEESGLPHMAHAAWHALTLLTFMRHHPELDDRFPL